MSYKIALQMDDLSKINWQNDSTIRLGWGAIEQGYQLYYFQAETVSWLNGELYAQVHSLELKPGDYEFYKLSPAKLTNLETMKVIFIRQDPPFDQKYLTNTYFLEQIAEKVLLINDPAAIRKSQEKLVINQFIDLIPSTIITAELELIEQFINSQEQVVIKPLYGFAGHDITIMNKNNFNSKIIIDLKKKYADQQLVIQQYLPEISAGDKRVILFAGEPIGAFIRIPAPGKIAANLAQGGQAFKSNLTNRDLEICQAIKPYLVSNKLWLVGIDIIGDYLTEINVTSPAGITNLNNLNNSKMESEIWQKINKIMT